MLCGLRLELEAERIHAHAIRSSDPAILPSGTAQNGDTHGKAYEPGKKCAGICRITRYSLLYIPLIPHVIP